jgi:hypothetical protein
MKLFLVLAFAFFGGLGSHLFAQDSLSNDDVPKLVKTGLSDELILKLIDQHGSKLSGDATHLIELRNKGVSERIIAAIALRNPSGPLTSYALIQVAKAQFSEGFLLDLVNQLPGQIATDASRLIELKRAGLSESVICAVVEQNSPAEPLTTDAIVHLAKAGFSERFIIGLLSRQQRKFSTEVLRELPAGTEITIQLIDSIDSEKNNAGDEFRASLDSPIKLGDVIFAPKGADATVGLVAEKDSGKLTGKTELAVQLLSFAVDGKMVPVHTASVTERSSSRGARTAKTAVAAGAVGAIIGALAGGGRGAAIGAGAGGAVGASSQVFRKGQRVLIPSETFLTFTTLEAVIIP